MQLAYVTTLWGKVSFIKHYLKFIASYIAFECLMPALFLAINILDLRIFFQALVYIICHLKRFKVRINWQFMISVWGWNETK